MKRIYKSREKSNFLQDLKNEDLKHDIFIILSKDLHNELDFLRNLVLEKNDKFSVSVGTDFILAEPVSHDNGEVTFLKENLMDIITKY